VPGFVFSGAGDVHWPVRGPEAGKVGGFSLHAGVVAEAHESVKLQRLCRTITRPAISEQRLSVSPRGRVLRGLLEVARGHAIAEPLVRAPVAPRQRCADEGRTFAFSRPARLFPARLGACLFGLAFRVWGRRLLKEPGTHGGTTRPCGTAVRRTAISAFRYPWEGQA
jgi:hypothetical protein